ncbi:MAG TPA: hypothetical protein VGC51_06960, partial [Hansschlegelia sp.]
MTGLVCCPDEHWGEAALASNARGRVGNAIRSIMKNTKLLLLAGTVLPVFALAAPGHADTSTPRAPIVLAQSLDTPGRGDDKKSRDRSDRGDKPERGDKGGHEKPDRSSRDETRGGGDDSRPAKRQKDPSDGDAGDQLRQQRKLDAPSDRDVAPQLKKSRDDAETDRIKSRDVGDDKPDRGTRDLSTEPREQRA